MSANQLTGTNRPQSSHELICNQCKRPAPVIIEGASGRNCAACTQALRVAELVDELSEFYDFYETKLEQGAVN